MAMSVYNAQYKLGIDTTTLKQVSNEILKRAAEKNSQYNTSSSSVNNNIFKNTQNLGIDLYNGKVDTAVARQVAMNNSGMQIQLNQEVLKSIQYLNTQAAQNLQKNVEGKITVALNEGVGNTQKNGETPKFNSIISLAAGKDKNGSAPSYKGEFLFIKKDKDKEEVLEMMKVFYASPAVLHKASEEILEKDIDDCIGKCPFIEGYVFECNSDNMKRHNEEDKLAGYAMLAKSYSTEYGGMCVWIEDIYIKNEYRGMGIGSKFFEKLQDMYGDDSVRFRLEVEPENERAVAVYEKCGYKKLPYMQMTKEL